MRILPTLFLFSTFSSVLSAQSFRESRTVWASDSAEVPAIANEVDGMLSSGRLVYERSQVDGSFQGRQHERMNQYHRGVRVFGGQLVWQKQSGLVLSVTGNVYDDISINTTPTLTASRAEARALKLEGPEAFVVGDTEIVVLPLADGYVLAYYVLTRSPDVLQVSFIDAHSGERVLTWNDIRTQYEGVGLGIGTWGDRKKMTTEQAVGTFRAVDTIRPFGIKTYDMNFNYLGRLRLGRTGNDLYLASDIDNEWRGRGAVVDAHVYSGYTYDYYFKRHNRRGLDDRSLVAKNYVQFFPRYPIGHPRNNNAFYLPFDNSVNYGDGDGKTFAPFSSALDVVAHEITHGVTQHSSDLIYRNESGALNEAISDIMGVATEFFFQPVGDGRLKADWLGGEDLFIDFGPYFRSFSSPTSGPDHYSIRYTGDLDNGGVHYNSSIANHAYYLMVMGGTNRVSGISVTGIGFAQMERMERIFYRGFMYYLVPSSNFSDAREATIRAARELYGAGGVEEQTVRAGWNAVGVQ